jgi:hypothetical protein
VTQAWRQAAAVLIGRPGGALMARFGDTPPSVLVLGGGGLLGEAWMTGMVVYGMAVKNS